MIILEDTLISDDIVEKKFCCSLNSCKGACCIEGDRGAPLSQEEVEILQKDLSIIQNFLDPEGIRLIAKKGFYEIDDDGDMVTTCLPDGRCAFVTQDELGILQCGIEKAHNAGATDFKKPISCHLYPIRLKEMDTYTLINYHEWQICKAACSLGEDIGMPLYQFVKDALIRKFGEEWYSALQKLAIEKFDGKEKRN